VVLGQEAAFAAVTCALLVIPLVVLFRGYVRRRNPRMLMAAFAVSLFFLTDFYLLLAHLGWLPGAEETELVEFLGDVGTAGMLALTFTLKFGGDA
jgi:hypothetical protein